MAAFTLAAIACSPVTASAAAAPHAPRQLVIAGGTQRPTETQCYSSNCAPSAGYIVDSEEIKIDGGRDVPLPGLSPMHRIDVKWTIKNTTRCVNLGTDPCPSTGLRYPGLACVNAKGKPQIVCGSPGWDWSGLSDDRGLECPSFKTDNVALKPGQSVTICTSSLLFPQEVASVLSYSLGYDPPTVLDTSHITVYWSVTDPWNPRTAKSVPIKYKHWKCTREQEKKWSGDDPPACTSTGAFRRVYSGRGYFGAAATVTLPVTESDLAEKIPNEHQLKKQVGYIYLEGWAKPGATNYEFGLEYNEDANNYTLYSHGPGKWWNPAGADKGIRFTAGDKMRLSMYAYPPGSAANSQWPQGQGCDNHDACLVVRAQDLTTRKVIVQGFNAPGWSGNRLIFARMTSIAQEAVGHQPGDIFNDGAIFGPVHWSDAELARLSGGKVHAAPWAGGRQQDWPDDPTRVIVYNRDGQLSETDILDLHP